MIKRVRIPYADKKVRMHGLPRARSSLICLLSSRSMKGVSPKGKYGGIRLCQTSGAGMVSKKGFSLPSVPGMCWGFVDERMLPRSGADAWPDASAFLLLVEAFEPPALPCR